MDSTPEEFVFVARFWLFSARAYQLHPAHDAGCSHPHHRCDLPEVVMQQFDHPDSIRASQAGDHFIRRGVMYPCTRLEPPHLICSISPHGSAFPVQTVFALPCNPSSLNSSWIQDSFCSRRSGFHLDLNSISDNK